MLFQVSWMLVKVLIMVKNYDNFHTLLSFIISETWFDYSPFNI